MQRVPTAGTRQNKYGLTKATFTIFSFHIYIVPIVIISTVHSIQHYKFKFTIKKQSERKQSKQEYQT